MNLDDRTQLRRYNEHRQAWGTHASPQRRPINWYALVLPVGMALGALILAGLLQVLLAWAHTL